MENVFEIQEKMIRRENVDDYAGILIGISRFLGGDNGVWLESLGI